MGYLHDLDLFTRLFGIGITLSMIQLRKWNLKLLDSSQFHNQWTQKPGLGLWIYTCRSTKSGFSPLSRLGLEYHSITDRNQVALVKSPCEVAVELTKMRTRMVSLQQVNKPICRRKMAALPFFGYSSNIVTDRLSTITLKSWAIIFETKAVFFISWERMVYIHLNWIQYISIYKFSPWRQGRDKGYLERF